jgi:hypothetical protein
MTCSRFNRWSDSARSLTIEGTFDSQGFPFGTKRLQFPGRRSNENSKSFNFFSQLLDFPFESRPLPSEGV